MAQQFNPLDVCIVELRALIEQRASGIAYLSDPQNNVAAITLNDGIVESVKYQGCRGDAALELIKGMAQAKCAFRAEPVRARGQVGLSANGVRWITGGELAPIARAELSAIPAPANQPGGNADLQKYRKVVESIALSFIGPIASALCEGAFSDGGSLDEVIDELAANLPPDEASRFRNEVAAAVWSGRTKG